MENELLLQIGIALVSSLVGGWVGYRLGISAEQRKEYNELADKLFLQVDRKPTAACAHNFGISEADVKLLERRMSWYQRRRFQRALAKYRSVATTRPDAAGQLHFVDTDAVNLVLRELAKILKRR
ncbi:MAG: hypothetical protein R3C09_19855 [Pirellulaceae bacterium]